MKTFYCHATAGFPFTNPDHIYDRMRQRIPRQSSIKFTQSTLEYFVPYGQAHKF